MTSKSLNESSDTVVAVAANADQRSNPAAAKTRLLTALKSGDPDERGDAWQNAGPIGAVAIKPLARVMAESELEVSRSARRAMWKIVRYAGSPATGSDRQQAQVVARLTELLSNDQPDAVRREVLWMLSELAGDEAVDPIAALLDNETLREDARLVLDRIPGDKSLRALKQALKTVPADFKINIAQSLRHRGVEVPGLPCQKLVPTKRTNVKPVQG